MHFRSTSGSLLVLFQFTSGSLGPHRWTYEVSHKQGFFKKSLKCHWKKVIDRGYISIFFIFIVFLTFSKSCWNFKCSFLSLIFVRFTKSHWKSRWFLKKFCRNFPTFRRPTTSLPINNSIKKINFVKFADIWTEIKVTSKDLFRKTLGFYAYLIFRKSTFGVNYGASSATSSSFR